MQDIDVVILCGGKGSRLQQVVNDRPKPMADINGRPFLDIILDYYYSFGFSKFILCLGYKADFITTYYQNKKNKYEILFSAENKVLGTAGALKNAEELIHSNSFFVINGDSFCPINLTHFLDFHCNKKAQISIALTTSNDVKEYGQIILDSSCKVVNFVEKSEKKVLAYINTGIYIFNKKIFLDIPANNKFSIEYDLFPAFLNNRFYGFKTNTEFIDIGTPERYEYAKKKFKLQI